MTLVDAIRMFPDDAAAEAWFVERRWPDGPHCPHCGSTEVLSGAKHATMPYRCRGKACRKRFSVRTKTVMDSSNVGYQKWALALFLFATSLKGVSSMKLHRDLGVTQKTAWFMAHRIRDAWTDHGEPFDGPVEADETYMGGKRKNMPLAKRAYLTSRGTDGKTAVAGVKDRATKQVRAQVVEHTDKATLQGFVLRNAAPDAKVYTDDASAYHGLPRDREAVNHSVFEYVRGQAHTNGIESFWSMLKRGYYGTFHHMSAKHLGRYVSEFAGRHNVRPLDTIDQLRSMVRGMEGRVLRYRDLVR
ncbi:MAG: IS1595 family transposase [Proteobacteria bacterium]|nr:IS1595 family transposase [Pseudomonadota bacterium]MYJ97298.1 IS1595 family transposase [Pseudomonadota bacterium]